MKVLKKSRFRCREEACTQINAEMGVLYEEAMLHLKECKLTKKEQQPTETETIKQAPKDIVSLQSDLQNIRKKQAKLFGLFPLPKNPDYPVFCKENHKMTLVSKFKPMESNVVKCKIITARSNNHEWEDSSKDDVKGQKPSMFYCKTCDIYTCTLCELQAINIVPKLLNLPDKHEHTLEHKQYKMDNHNDYRKDGCMNAPLGTCKYNIDMK